MTTKELPVTNCPLKTKTLSDKRRWDAFAQQWVYEEEDVKEFINVIITWLNNMGEDTLINTRTVRAVIEQEAGVFKFEGFA